jgi:hypothetical protein
MAKAPTPPAPTSNPGNDNTSKQHDNARKDFDSGKSPQQSRDEQRISTPKTGPDGKK